VTIWVRIGNDEREYSERENSWINEQIRRRRAEEGEVCVQVKIDHGAIQLVLFTSDCRLGGRGGHLNRVQNDVFELWKQMHLNEKDFTGGNLIAFLRQVLH
jgi:hypothetical protein